MSEEMQKLFLEQFILLNQQFGEMKAEIKLEIKAMRKEMTERFEEHDKRFDRIDKELKEHDKRFDRIDKELKEHDERFDRIDKELKENLTDISEMFQGVFRKLDEKADKDSVQNSGKNAVNY